MRSLGFALLLTVGGTQGVAQPTAEEFATFTISSGAFLEQCIARNLLDLTDVHNNNHKILEKQGMLYGTDWWMALRQGTEGQIYDLVKANWVGLPFSSDNCEYVRSEQEKVYHSLSRYE